MPSFDYGAESGIASGDGPKRKLRKLHSVNMIDGAAGQLPRISAIACNALTWSLAGQKFTAADRYEASFQVSHLSHMLLVLRLLGNMDAGLSSTAGATAALKGGRMIMLSSEMHDLERGLPLLYKLRAKIKPDQIYHLIHPPSDKPEETYDRGVQQYATAKLANVAFMWDLNRRLQQDPKLSAITVTCMDPGGLVESRAHSEQKPTVRLAMGVVNVLMPVLRHLTSTIRTNNDAGRDLVALSVGPEFQGKRGFIVGQNEAVSAKLNRDEAVQRKLWDACLSWAGISTAGTVLAIAEAE
ncbi:hypothetical protein C7999DRAFT_35275 [Corynascus novoguineensis]|uniref:Short-chain dehydrogenase n=1 Tax=Corynascus novoguineensis TaxID=1126955 RepID=A0AAN7HC43_9PEZI|nr:hypothetical protein C7999DRAFT_35275 [Corynascus novoguineensis]